MPVKPFCKNSLEVLAHIDGSKPVRVYRNLHKKCISVKQGTLVRCHAENVVLKDCKFIVSEAGQKRVRDQGKKNVHAFIEGHVVDARRTDELLDFGWDTVYYNPYSTDHWVISTLPYDKYVDTAEWCDVWCDDVLGEVSAFNLTYLKVMV
jgi:hypothetical protein